MYNLSKPIILFINMKLKCPMTLYVISLGKQGLFTKCYEKSSHDDT